MDYQFKEIEQKWQKYWAEHQSFKADINKDKPKYYVLDMFPYPSGAGLHVGHPLGYIASDIFSRFKRLKGYNVLHPMGYDSFGLPAEQYAIQTGQHPAITTETNINTYRRQLDQIGFSFDWSKEVRTSDPSYYKWTQWIFMQLFNAWYNQKSDKAEPINSLINHFKNQGSEGVLAVCDEDVKQFSADEWKAFSEEEKAKELLKYRLTYLKESTVNWCPALGTVLANDEVKDGFSERGGHPVEQKKMMQWSMRITAYAERLLQGLETIDWPEPLKEMQRNWIGKSVGASVIFPFAPKEGSKSNRPGYVTGGNNSRVLLPHAKDMRNNPTEAERVLWECLKSKSLGYKFRQQHLIADFIVDFVCLSKKLVIEVDGKYHETQQEYDAQRTEILKEKGFEVILFTNDEVLGNIDSVLERITLALSKIPPSGVRGIEVFTTRIDTIFGVSFMVLAPEHELVAQLTAEAQKEAVEAYIKQTQKRTELDRMADTKTVSGAFTGSYVINPFNNEQVPIWISDYVLAGYGTGAVMGVPSGDERDWRFANHFNLPIIPIMDCQNELEKQANPSKEGRYINSGFINGMNYQEATDQLNQWIEENGYGKAKINYRMRDAIFGRQRYWGEPIPVYFKDEIPHLIEENELPLLLPEIDKYLPTETGEPPLARAENWQPKRGANYELSTMPGWAGSSWYWYRYMDSQNTTEFASKEAIGYWKDVDLYIGGSEHATGHLLYSRFWNKFLKDMGYVQEEEPFKKLINQGMIQGRSNFVYRLSLIYPEKPSKHYFISKGLRDKFVHNEGLGYDLLDEWGIEYEKHDFLASSQGIALVQIHVDVNIVENDILNIEAFKKFRPEFKDAEFILENGKYVCGHEVEKMSKSKFNVVNPDDLIQQYGADTLRMYEMFLGPLEQSKPWNTNGIEGVFKFLRKFWRLFHNDKNEFEVSNAEPTKAELKALHKIIKKVQDDIERFSFNTSVSHFMIAVNELSDLKCNKRQILEPLTVTLAAYAPHISEELWSLLGHQDLSTASYPEFKAEYLVEDEFAYPISINGKMKMNLNMSLTLDEETVKSTVLANAQVQSYLDGKTPKKIIFVKGKIVNMVV